MNLLLLIVYTIIFCKNGTHSANSTINTVSRCFHSMYSIYLPKGLTKSHANESYEFNGVLYPKGTYLYEWDKILQVKGCICLVRTCRKICTSFDYVTDGNFSNVISTVKCDFYFSTTNNASEINLKIIERQTNRITKKQIDDFCSLFFPNEEHCYYIIYYMIDAACLLASIGFSAVILIVFAMIPELRNLNGKLIMCYVFAILVYHITGILAQNIYNFYFVYFIYFAHINVVFWSNAISHDIWSTFG